MKKKIKPLPVDIKLPEGEVLEGGTMFVILKTLDELEQFWQTNKHQFQFACEGKLWDEPVFLNSYEWVFGPSKSAVVRTVMRWGQCDIACEFFEWAKIAPAEHISWFADRDADRQSYIESGCWSDADEKEYQADCILRTPDSYRGWWQFKNLPPQYSPSEWFSPWCSHEELWDFNMPIAQVERVLQEQTFDDWKSVGGLEHIEFHDQSSIEEIIAYWRNEKNNGMEYYGDENEAPIRPVSDDC